MQTHVIGVGQQLTKLGLVGSMGAFDFPIELRRSRFDVNMLDALVFDMPVKLSLKLMPPVDSDRVDAERKLLDDIIHELDGARLVMP